MTSTKSERSLVVLQLSGGNDALNTVVPHSNELYYDFRPDVHIPQDEVLKLDDDFGFNPSMGPVKSLWDEGKVAVIQGIGYPNPNRSHFRSMDIWHTAQPEGIGDSGWLGRAIREMDPSGDNVLTGVNFGRGLPRALSCKGVPVASVGNLETYGLLPDIQDEFSRKLALEAFTQIYGTGEGKDAVGQFLGQTGMDALKGADTLRTAPTQYSSTVEYAADNPVAQNLKSIAQVMSADLGTRIYYTQHGSFDTHAAQLESHAKLWTDVSNGVGDFIDDLREHGLEDNTLILIFTEFGRRIKDNSAGTDHGSGGTALVIGGQVNGGFYGEFPSLREKDHLEGDLHFNNDFRSTYSTIAERWLGLNAPEIVNGTFEQLGFVSNGNGHH